MASDASAVMGRPGDVRAGTVKLSLLAALALFCLIPGAAPSQSQSQRPRPRPAPESSHRRLRRGWIWKQLFVPEEDPTPQVIGQVAPQVKWPPHPSSAVFCGLFFKQRSLSSSGRTLTGENPPSGTSCQEKEPATSSR